MSPDLPTAVEALSRLAQEHGITVQTGEPFDFASPVEGEPLIKDADRNPEPHLHVALQATGGKLGAVLHARGEGKELQAAVENGAAQMLHNLSKTLNIPLPPFQLPQDDLAATTPVDTHAPAKEPEYVASAQQYLSNGVVALLGQLGIKQKTLRQEPIALFQTVKGLLESKLGVEIKVSESDSKQRVREEGMEKDSHLYVCNIETSHPTFQQPFPHSGKAIRKISAKEGACRAFLSDEAMLKELVKLKRTFLDAPQLSAGS